MKIAFLADTHFGARNDAPLFLDHFLDFFENSLNERGNVMGEDCSNWKR